MTGTLYGVGVGPGDPELLTLRALRVIRECPVVAYPASVNGGSQARSIVAQWLGQEGQRELPIPIPCQMDRGPANRAYDEAAEVLSGILAGGEDVAVLCEGDPLFYGSFIYFQERLGEHFPCIVVPGVTSVSATAAAAGQPVATGSEQVVIVPATAGETALRKALSSDACVAIMKPGRERGRILALLHETGRATTTVYVEQASRAEQRVVTAVDELPETPGPYFAMFLAAGAWRPSP